MRKARPKSRYPSPQFQYTAAYGALGKILQPTGSRIPTAARWIAYPSSDGKWILIAASSEPLFARLVGLVGRPDFLQGPRFHGNRARVVNVVELDAIISTWTRQLPIDELERRLATADLPSTPVYSAAECATGPQFCTAACCARWKTHCWDGFCIAAPCRMFPTIRG